jgi:hypothetical protein
MYNRRDVLILGSSSLLAAVAPPVRVRAAGVESMQFRLQTKFFNFRDDVPAAKRESVISDIAKFSKLPGVTGLMTGKNIVQIRFPARFEWMYMLQVNETMRPEPSRGSGDVFRQVHDSLVPYCRNDVECDLLCPIAANYADAKGVKVRHTVMFDFKPEATPEARARNVAAIRGMGKLPMVQNYLVQESVSPTPNPPQMQWQVTGDFRSLADYKAYSEAPVHLAIRKDFTANTSRVTFLDVEL